MDYVSHLIQTQPPSRRPHGFIIIEPPQNDVYRGTLELRNGGLWARIYYLFGAPPFDCNSHELAIFMDTQMEWPMLQTVVRPDPDDHGMLYIEHFIDQCLHQVLWSDGDEKLFCICNTFICKSISKNVQSKMVEDKKSPYYSQCFDASTINEYTDGMNMALDTMIGSIIYSIKKKASELQIQKHH